MVHSTHSTPNCEYVESGHWSHDVLSLVGCSPGLHGTQLDAPSPGTLVRSPVEQCRHVSAPPPAYLPTGHTVHSDVFCWRARNRPGAQLPHAMLRRVLGMPVLWSCTSFPAGHNSHTATAAVLRGPVAYEGHGSMATSKQTVSTLHTCIHATHVQANKTIGLLTHSTRPRAVFRARRSQWCVSTVLARTCTHTTTCSSPLSSSGCQRPGIGHHRCSISVPRRGW
jgi:hypothetical protein